MKKEQLYDVICDINETYINDAHKTPNKKTALWIKGCSMAACLCLIIAVAFFAINGIPHIGPEEDMPRYGNTISYVGWSEDQTIYKGAVNKELLQSEPDTHLPVFKMDTLEDLEQFKNKYENVFSMDQGYDNILSFDGALTKAQWNRETFFSEYSLLVIYVPANSSSFRFGIQEVVAKDNSLCVHVEQKNDPEVITNDMAGWFILIEVEDKEIRNYTSIDAIWGDK